MAELLNSAGLVKFGHLPTEIRSLIWKMTLPGPRIVTIEVKQLRGQGTRVPFPWALKRGQGFRGLSSFFGITSESIAPSGLFVCRESYEVAKEVYEPAFCIVGGIPSTYFNFEFDTLYFRKSLLRDNMTGNFLGFEYATNVMEDGKGTDSMIRVENLAIEAPGNSPLGINISEILAAFQGVKCLTVIAKHYSAEDDGHSDISFMEIIDVPKTCEIYENWEGPRWDIYEHPEPVRFEADFVSVDSRYLHTQKIVPYDFFLGEMLKHEKDGDRAWPMPELHYKVAVTGRLKARYDAALERCMRETFFGDSLMAILGRE